MSRRHDERGSAVVEFVFLTVVVLVPLIYLILTVARVQAGTYAVTQAAREAGRAYVTSEAGDNAPARAYAAADIAFADFDFVGVLEIGCDGAPCCGQRDASPPERRSRFRCHSCRTSRARSYPSRSR